MTRGRFTLLVVVAALVAIVAITGLSIDLSGGDDDGGEKRSSEPASPTPTATAEAPEVDEDRRREVSKLGADPDVVRGSEEIALTRPRNLERAMRVLERERNKEEGVFESLRIAPGRIDTQIRNKRVIVNLQLRPDFSIPFSNRIDFPGDDAVIERGLRGRDVKERAPSLILRGIDRRRPGATAAADLDYMVVSKSIIDHTISWSAFLKRGPEPRSWRAEGPDLKVTPIG